jgi:hypothetical protein
MLERSRKKRPRDVNQLAKKIVDLTTGDVEPNDEPKKNAAAVELGRLGGKKGGVARAAKLSPERRKEIALKASKARWEK